MRLTSADERVFAIPVPFVEAHQGVRLVVGMVPIAAFVCRTAGALHEVSCPAVKGTFDICYLDPVSAHRFELLRTTNGPSKEPPKDHLRTFSRIPKIMRC